LNKGLSGQSGLSSAVIESVEFSQSVGEESRFCCMLGSISQDIPRLSSLSAWKTTTFSTLKRNQINVKNYVALQLAVDDDAVRAGQEYKSLLIPARLQVRILLYRTTKVPILPSKTTSLYSSLQDYKSPYSSLQDYRSPYSSQQDYKSVFFSTGLQKSLFSTALQKSLLISTGLRWFSSIPASLYWSQQDYKSVFFSTGLQKSLCFSTGLRWSSSTPASLYQTWTRLQRPQLSSLTPVVNLPLSLVVFDNLRQLSVVYPAVCYKNWLL